MKKLFLFISLFISWMCFGQSVSQRSNGTSTVNDPRQMHTINLFIPRYADTTTANIAPNLGIDSCGAIIFTYADSGRVYVRKCFPVKYWAAIGSGGGGGSGSITGNNAVTASTSTNLQWGGTLIKNTTIDGGIGYEVNFQNIGQYTIYSDAGSTTRLKISSTATNLFAPNGGSGYILKNDSLYEIGTGRSNDTLYKIRTINPITGAEAYSNWTGLGVKANNGTSVSAATVQIGGSDLIQYSAIGLNGFPLTLNHNGVNNAAQSDSNTIRLSNNTASGAITDSLVSPGIIWSVNARRTLGAASQNVKFLIDEIGVGGSGANALWRLKASINGVAYSTLYSISAAGAFQQNLNVNGTVFGRATGLGGGTIIGNTTNLSAVTVASSRNLAFGGTSMTLNTDGNDNTAIGYQTLITNLTGSFNTAIGNNTLLFNTAGTNTAVGFSAMLNNSTGASNTAIGVNALTNNTTAQKNTAIGAGAMENNTTGGFNTVVGEDGLLHNTTGTNNIAIGWLSGALNQIGIGNVSIGFNAGTLVASGDNNTFLGLSSGNTGGQEDTVTHSIAIGANSFTTASNQMVLGSTNIHQTKIFGSQVGSGTDSLYSRKSDGTLGAIAQSSIVGATPTWEQTIIQQGATAFTQNNSVDIGSNNFSLTNVGLYGISSIVTSATGLNVTSTTLTGGQLVQMNAQTTAAIGSSQKVLNVSLGGANSNSSITSYGIYALNSHTGTTSTNITIRASAVNGTTNIAGQFIAGGGTDNYALDIGAASSNAITRWNGGTSGSILIQTAAIAGTYTLTLPTTDGNNLEFLQTDGNGVLTWAAASGSVTWNGISNPTGDQALTFDVGESSTWTNSNTTEDLLTINTSTLTTASLFSLNSTSTALAAGNNLAELIMSGVNGSNAITATALKISVTNTNVTSGTNIGIDVTATGATTNNIALKVTGTTASSTAYSAQFIGRVAMGGVTAPQADLDLGNGIILTGGLSISPAGGGSTGNMLSGTTNILTGNTNAIYQVLSSTTIDGRIFFGGTGATAVGAGRPYGTVIIGGATVPESGSGTHALLSSLIIKAPSITGGVATVTNTSTIYIEGAPSATVSGANYSLWVDDGLVRLDAGILMGAGTATAGTAPIKLTSGTNMTVAEAGAVEYDATELFATNSTAVRGSIIVVRLNSSSAGTLTLATTYTHYVFTGTTTTWTLPAVSGTTNHIFHIKNRGSGAITINTAAAANEIYSTSAVNTYTVNAGEAIVLLSDGTFWNLE